MIESIRQYVRRAVVSLNQKLFMWLRLSKFQHLPHWPGESRRVPDFFTHLSRACLTIPPCPRAAVLPARPPSALRYHMNAMPMPTASLQTSSWHPVSWLFPTKKMSSVQTITIERRHTMGTSPADSIALPTQKRHSLGIDWSFQSHRARERRSKDVSALTPVPEHANVKPSSSADRHSFFLSKRMGSKQRAQSASTLPTISEDTLLKPRARAKSFNVSEVAAIDSSQSSDSQRNRRSSWAKRLSWVTGWTFAGPSSLDAIEEADTSGTTTPLAERRKSRLSSIGYGVGKRLSSFSQAASDFQAAVNEPSHESNFPASFSWPAETGTKMTMPVYGTVDALTPDGMRILMPCGARSVSFTGKASKNEEILAQDICSQLKNGDMLCEDAKLGAGSGLATVLRGDMQGFCFKCSVVGLFPMKLLGREEELPEPYFMDIMVF